MLGMDNMHILKQLVRNTTYQHFCNQGKFSSAHTPLQTSVPMNHSRFYIEQTGRLKGKFNVASWPVITELSCPDVSFVMKRPQWSCYRTIKVSVLLGLLSNSCSVNSCVAPYSKMYRVQVYRNLTTNSLDNSSLQPFFLGQSSGCVSGTCISKIHA